MAIWPSYLLVSDAGMHGLGWEYHNQLEIIRLNIDDEWGYPFLLGECVVLVEHISAVVLDAKTLY